MLRLLPTLFVLGLLCSLSLTWLVQKLCQRFDLVSRPTLHRHLHTKSVPRLGGVAVFGAFTAALWSSNALLKFFGLHDFAIGITHASLSAIIVAGAMVFAVGLYDDVRGCGPWPKLTVEAFAALLICTSGVRIGAFPFFGQQFGTAASCVITVVFVLVVTNAFNLIDGMDGLAAGSATLSILPVAIIAGMNHHNPALLISVGLAGVLLGFLRFNYAPATIFLGDSGSLFIGFALSAAAISGTQKLPTFVAAVAPVMVFGLPLLDTALSVVRRALRGQSIFSADRDHIHHRLLRRGMNQTRTVLALYAVSAVAALLTLLLLYSDARATALVLLGFIALMAVVTKKLEYPELRDLRAASQRVKILGLAYRNIALWRAVRTARFCAEPELAVSTINGVLAQHDARIVFLDMQHELSVSTAPQSSKSVEVCGADGQLLGKIVLISGSDRQPIHQEWLVSFGAALADVHRNRPTAMTSEL